MALTGLDKTSGAELCGLAHLVQSIEDILTTKQGSRIYRETYGSRLPQLVDAPLNDSFAMEAAVAIAEALDTEIMGEPVEPRFSLRRVLVPEFGYGSCRLILEGETDLSLGVDRGLEVGSAASSIQATSHQAWWQSFSREQALYDPASQAETARGQRAGRVVIMQGEMAVINAAGTFKPLLPPLQGSMRVYLNGQRLSPSDWQKAGDGFALNLELDEDDKVELDYQAFEPAEMPSHIELSQGASWLVIDGISLGRA